MNKSSLPARTRRTSNWWEVIFDPHAPTQKEHGWDFSYEKGPVNATLRHNNDAKLKVVEDVIFRSCDFSGVFPENSIIFKNCEFILCDFGLSTFNRTKFSKCKFRKTSFTQCRLLNCQFQSCEFDEIGISDTDIESTYISNPLGFMEATTTNLNNLPEHVSREHQVWKFEETRSAVARQLLANHSKEGPESSFYSAVEAAAIQECRARQGRARLNYASAAKDVKKGLRIRSLIRNTLSYWLALSDEYLMRSVGLANGWGKSTSRVAVIGLIIWIAFSIAYRFFDNLPLSSSFLKSAELQFLFGYTKHTSRVGEGMPSEVIIFLNALLGLFWYLIFVPTLINRMTRIRS